MTIQINDQSDKVKTLQTQLKLLGYPVPAEEANGNIFGMVTRAACLHFLKKNGLPTSTLQNKGTLDDPSLQAIAKAAGAVKQLPPAYGFLYGKVSTYENVLSKTKMTFVVNKPIPVVTRPVLTPVAPTVASTPTILPPAPPFPGNVNVVREHTVLNLIPSPDQQVLETFTDGSGFYVFYFDPGISKVTVQIDKSVWRNINIGGRFDILFSLRVGSKGNDVKTLHRMLYNLGYLIPQEEIKAEYFGEATKSAILHFNPRSNVAQGDLPLAEYQNIKVQAEQRAIPGKKISFFSLVIGKVVQGDVPLKGVSVQAFDVDFVKRATPLGNMENKCLTDSEGNYYIYYSFNAQGGKTRPTLKVVITDSTGKELKASDLLYQAREIETVNFSIGNVVTGAVSEFERIKDILAPFFQAIMDTTKSLDDIVHLTAETGIETKKIFFFVYANRLVKRADDLLKDKTGTAPVTPSPLPSFVFYGLFSQGLPVDPSQFLQRSSHDLETALLNAHDQGVIPTQFDPSLDKILQSLSDLRVNWIADQSNQLKNVFPDQKTRVNFLKRGVEVSDPIRLSMTLSSLAGHNTDLFGKIAPKFSSIKALALNKREDWSKMLKDVQDKIPADIPGKNNDEKRENYATFLEVAVKRKFPQTILQSRLEQKTNSNEAKNIVNFLGQNQDFNFQKHHIDTFLAQPTAKLNGLNKQTLSLSLKKFQRLSKISTDPDDVIVLQDAGFESAYDITKMSLQNFVKTMTVMDSKKATQIYAEAQNQAATALFLMTRFGNIFNLSSMPSIPSWDQMFGSLELCACEDCCSIYGPAAYLVDILEFIDKRGVKDILFAKRPDLGETELSCPNTLTALPYIDLVIEILEDQIIPSQAKRKKTTKTTEELVLEPEYLNQDVYRTKLSQVYYPCNLPFNLSLEEGRLYLKRLGYTRKELIEQFAEPYLDIWTLETLGLSKEEKTAIFDKDTLSLDILWGESDPKILSKVPVFLDKTKLTFEQLQTVTHIFSTQINSSDLGSCDLSLMRLETNGGPLSPLTLNNLSKALRLWRKLASQFGEGAPTLNNVFLSKLSDINFFQNFFQVSYKDLLALIDSQLFPIPGSSTSPPQTIEKLSLEIVAFMWIIFQKQNGELPSLTAWDILIAGGVLSASIGPSLGSIAFLCHILAKDVLPSFEDLYAVHGLKMATDFKSAFKVWEDLQHKGIQLGQFDVFKEPPELKKARDRATNLLDLTGLNGAMWDPVKQKNTLPFKLGTNVDIENLLSSGEKNVTDLSLAYVIRKVKEDNDSTLLTSIFEMREKLKKDLTSILSSMQLILTLEMKRMDVEASQLQSSMNTLDPTDVVEKNKMQTQLDLIKLTKLNFVPFSKKLDLLLAAPLGISQLDIDQFSIWLNIDADFEKVKEGLTQLIEQLASKMASAPTSSLVSWVVSSFTLPVEMAMAILEELKGVSIFTQDSPEISKVLTTWGQMSQLAAMVHSYSLTPEFIRWACRQKPEARLCFPTDFEGKKELLCLLKAHKELGGTDLLNVLQAPGDKKFELLSGILEIDLKDLQNMDGKLDDLTLTPLGAKLLELREKVRLLQKGGVSRSNVLSWIGDTVSFDQTKVLKDCLKKQNLFGSTQEIRDELRKKQRDALVAYLLTHQPPGVSWVDSSNLYDQFYIDVEMNPFQKTSRIKQAISTVQLFVQRCLMGLESLVDTSQDHEWNDVWKKWMSTLPIWRVNKQIFVYPENWIEPELRDNKSPFFEDFEKELQQNSITAETAATAFMHYLDKVDQVAHLDICGMFHQFDKDGVGSILIDTLHVFGRSFGRPHIYYYRKKDNLKGGEWTAWEKVDLDIEGDHLFPVVWNNRLYLFWTMVAEKAKAKPVKMPTQDAPLKPAPKFREIRLVWSEYKDQKWVPKQISVPCIRVPKSYVHSAGKRVPIPKSQYAFRPVIGTDKSSGIKFLWIVCTTEANPNFLFKKNNIQNQMNPGVFAFAGRVGNPNLNGPIRQAEVPQGTSMLGVNLLPSSTTIMLPDIQDKSSLPDFKVEIGSLENGVPFTILMSYEGIAPSLQDPLFIKSSYQTFYVEWIDKPQLIEAPEWESAPFNSLLDPWLKDRIDKYILPLTHPIPKGDPGPIDASVDLKQNLETVLIGGV